MFGDMRNRLTFTRLGDLTRRIAWQLKASRTEFEEKAPAAALGGQAAGGGPSQGGAQPGNAKPLCPASEIEIVGKRVPARLPMRPGAFVASTCPAG